MRIRPTIFEHPISNEIQLSEDGKNQLVHFDSMPPSAEEILKLSRHYSPDLAARTFYEGLLISKHRTFIQLLKSYSSEDIKQKEKIKILLIPGMFYKEHPETGADGLLVTEIAQQFDFEVQCIEILSGGSVSKNSAIIANMLEQETHPNIWLLSISKGSSDLRHYLQNRKVKSNIKGWINIAGIIKGLPHMDYRLKNPFKRQLLRILCKAFKIDYQALHELQTHHHFWHKTTWPRGIEMIHILPIPHSAHIHNMLRKKYHKTLINGPNDGLTPITDILDIPGHIYPVWGCDHFMRTPDMSAYLYQLFNYLSDPQRRKQK